MATNLKYPEFKTYFHREENEPVNSFKCDKCGKEITEYKNCTCPHCGADIKKNLNNQCTTLLQQLFSGCEESIHEFEDDLLSDEFAVRMAELDGILKTIVDYSDELTDRYELEYKPYEAENEKLANNIFGKIVFGIVSLCNGGPGLGVGIGLALIFFLVVFQGILGVLFGLFGVVFIVVSIMALVKNRRSNVPYSKMLWFSYKNEVFHALKRSFIKDLVKDLVYNKNTTLAAVAHNITNFAEELIEEAKKAKREENIEAFNEFRDQATCFNDLHDWIFDMTALISIDYFRQQLDIAENDIDRKERQVLNPRRKHWDEFYENYGVFEA